MSEDDKKFKKLDDVIEKTFPASDPVNVGTPTGTEPSGNPMDRAPPLITKEQIDAAQRGEGHAHRDCLPSSLMRRQGTRNITALRIRALKTAKRLKKRRSGTTLALDARVQSRHNGSCPIGAATRCLLLFLRLPRRRTPARVAANLANEPEIALAWADCTPDTGLP